MADYITIGGLFVADIRNNRPTIAKLTRVDEPPYETNGRVIPVSGIRLVVPAVIIRACAVIAVVRPAAINC